VEDARAGDVHLVGRTGLVAGTGTEQWIDPAGPSGATYRVLACRRGDFRPGWLTTATGK
jgi:hypothetical protein